MVAQVHETRVISNKRTRTDEPTHSFTLGEWRAFGNGVKCALLNLTPKELAERRTSWSKAHQWAFQAGYDRITKMVSDPEVTFALYQRFSGEE